MNMQENKGNLDNGDYLDNIVYKILIVDDEKQVLNAMQETLKRNKYFKSEIVTAESGLEALNELKSQKFDIVLSDFKMPEMTGVELLAKVKDRAPSILRMLITGYSDLNTAKEAINKAEVNNYIEKPWDNNELILIIYEALKRKVEREAGLQKEFDNVTEALSLVHKLQRDLLDITPGYIKSKIQRINCEFSSVLEFNKFSFEIKKMGNVTIDDIYVYEKKLIIWLSIHPINFKKAQSHI